MTRVIFTHDYIHLSALSCLAFVYHENTINNRMGERERETATSCEYFVQTLSGSMNEWIHECVSRVFRESFCVLLEDEMIYDYIACCHHVLSGNIFMFLLFSSAENWLESLKTMIWELFAVSSHSWLKSIKFWVKTIKFMMKNVTNRFSSATRKV